MNVVAWLNEADRSFFYLINKKLAFEGLDDIMLIVRQPFTWIPLYLFFMLLFYINCRRYFLPVVALSLLTFAITDFTSASVLKPFIGRLRPCSDPSLKFIINNIAGCGGIFGMPSSHAANHFGLAAFWFFIVKKLFDQKWYWLWFWAVLICYSQIYAGVHFPGDILAGALLGVATAYLTSHLFNLWMERIDNQDSLNIEPGKLI